MLWAKANCWGCHLGRTYRETIKCLFRQAYTVSVLIVFTREFSMFCQGIYSANKCCDTAHDYSQTVSWQEMWNFLIYSPLIFSIQNVLSPVTLFPVILYLVPKWAMRHVVWKCVEPIKFQLSIFRRLWPQKCTKAITWSLSLGGSVWSWEYHFNCEAHRRYLYSLPGEPCFLIWLFIEHAICVFAYWQSNWQSYDVWLIHMVLLTLKRKYS